MDSSLRNNIYTILRGEILGCNLPPNAELREQVLAERFSVSKSPVREALLRLEQDRLVIVAPRQGYRVTPVSLEDAAEMFQLRRVLEVASVEAAVQHATDEALRSLESFRKVPPQRGEDPVDVFIRYNRLFHRALAQVSGNARMARTTCDLIDQMERLIRFSVSAVPSEDKHTLLREHNEIIDALLERDRRRAVRLVRDHVSDAEKRVVGSLTRMAVHL